MSAATWSTGNLLRRPASSTAPPVFLVPGLLPPPNRPREGLIPALGSLDRWSASSLAASGWLRAVRSQVRTFQGRYHAASASRADVAPHCRLQFRVRTKPH